MQKPRLIIADDHRLVVAGLEGLLASECDIVATSADGASLLAEVRRLFPDIVLLDISMPPFNGLDLIRQIQQIEPSIRVIVVTMNDDPDVAAEAFRAGASGYVLKNCAASGLLEAVRRATESQSYITPLVAGGVIDSLVKPPDHREPTQLTDRQREVLRLLAQGKSMKEVADGLNVAVRTVAFHKYRMMKQLNIKTNAELVRFAVARDMV